MVLFCHCWNVLDNRDDDEYASGDENGDDDDNGDDKNGGDDNGRDDHLVVQEDW